MWIMLQRYLYSLLISSYIYLLLLSYYVSLPSEFGVVMYVTVSTYNKRQRIPKGQSKWTIPRNWQHSRRKTKQKHNTICAGHHYMQASTNNVNKTWSVLQTTGGKHEPNIVNDNILNNFYILPFVLLPLLCWILFKYS
jgi:hypothetical protein